MKPITIFPLLALVSVASAQKPSDWRKSPVTPMQFGQKVDAGLFNIKDGMGQASYRCEFFDGSRGEALFVNRIRDRKTFRVEFVKVSEGGGDPFSRQTLISKNGQTHLLSPATGYKPLPKGRNPGFVPTNISMAAAWPRHFQQAMFQSYVSGSGSFAQLVKDLTAKGSGFQIRMDTRSVQGASRKIPQVRMIAVRTPAAAKKLGKATIEIVADTIMWLPLQVRINQTNPKGQNAYYEWRSLWRGPVRFDDSWFTLPKV